MNYYGTISLTKLGEFVRQHPECVREITFKDGHTEKMLSVDVRDRQVKGQYGDVAYISAYDKSTQSKVYLCDLKESKYAETAAMAQPQQEQRDIEYLKAAAKPVMEAFQATIVEPKQDDLPF